MEGASLMNPIPVYSKEYEIDVSHVDFMGKLKLSSLFLYFQDVATVHAEKLGIGMKQMQKMHNALWVLARIRVHIERYPLWGENITVETWYEKPRKVEITRNFLLKDIQGNILASAVSTWVVIDMDTRKLKRIDSVFSPHPDETRKRPIDCSLGRFQPNGPLERVYKRIVGYSDIDVNEHLNNSRYIDFIMDCFGIEYHKNYSVESIEIDYKNEAFAGDTITLFKTNPKDGSNVIYVEGVNEESNQLIFKCQLQVTPDR